MRKQKWFGALLNFMVPGLGNAYARKIIKGVIHYFLFFIALLSLRFIAYNFVLLVVSLTIIISFYLYLIISGYRDVQSDREYQTARFDRFWIYPLVIILHVEALTLLPGHVLDGYTPINFASIPTVAMDPTLVPGDKLAFKKVNSLQRNDVAMFWWPDDIKVMYVKRCIGMPGDSLQVSNGQVAINGNALTELSPLKFKYEVMSGDIITSRFFERHGVDESEIMPLNTQHGITYQLFLSDLQAKGIAEAAIIKKVEKAIATEGEGEQMIYPQSENQNWNADFYGPIYIPKRGDKIELTDKNIGLYLKCIQFENESVEHMSSGLIINGKAITTYVFKENYYFMMGDNRHNSLDSRYWGLLPEKLVVGKALYLHWGQTRDRIGKELI